GAEEERPAAFEFEDESGEVARALVVEALLAQAAGADFAVVVEDGEGVAVLEHAGVFVADAGRGEDVVGAVGVGGGHDASPRRGAQWVVWFLWALGAAARRPYEPPSGLRWGGAPGTRSRPRPGAASRRYTVT